MVRPGPDRIGGNPGEHVGADETYVDRRTCGKGRGVHDRILMAGAVVVKQRKQVPTSGGLDGTPNVFGSLWHTTEAQNCWASSLSA
jgi:hypothetical protein